MVVSVRTAPSVKGLELTSETLTDGTYSPLHGVYSRIHYSRSSSISDSDGDLKKRDVDASSSSSSSSSSETVRLTTESSVSSSYDERVFHRSTSKDNCGVLEFNEHEFVEDRCEARKHRLQNRGLVRVELMLMCVVVQTENLQHRLASTAVAVACRPSAPATRIAPIAPKRNKSFMYTITFSRIFSGSAFATIAIRRRFRLFPSSA
jgi:hypothetical protein